MPASRRRTFWTLWLQNIAGRPQILDVGGSLIVSPMKREINSTPNDATNGSDPTRQYVIGYRALQAVIGGIAISLVLVVYFENWLIFTHRVPACLVPGSHLPGSLGGFYYTHRPRLLRTRHHQARPRQRPTGPRYTIRSPSQNWTFGGWRTAHQRDCHARRVGAWCALLAALVHG